MTKCNRLAGIRQWLHPYFYSMVLTTLWGH
jgi:hypothetical protein